MQEKQQNNRVNEQDDLLKVLLFKYLPYWPVFILVMLLFMGGAWLYLQYVTPQYEAVAKLIIKDGKKGNEEAKVVESLDVLDGKEIVENEVEVLKSRTLMDQVVRSLHLYAPVYEESRLRSDLAYTSSPVLIELARPDEIEEVEKVSFSFNKEKEYVELGTPLKQYPLDQWVQTPYGKLKFLKNEKCSVPSDKPLYFSLVMPKRASVEMLDNLRVGSVNKVSSIVQLELRDAHPQRAEDILNELISAYQRAAVNDKNTLATNTLSFVDARLDAVSRELDSIERHIQRYRSSRGAIDIGTQGKLFLQNVSENDQKLSDINMKLAVLNKVEEYVMSKNNTSGIVPSTLGVDDPVLSQLLEKLYGSELEYEKLKTTVAENNPMLLSVTEQIHKIKPGILENIQNQRKGLMASRDNLYSTNASYNYMLQSIPQKERQLMEISREQNIKSGIYSFLLQKREESAISNASTVSDMKVVDKAQASLVPVTPRSKIVYLVSFVASLTFVTLLIGFRESLNQKILYRQEVEAITQVPVLGEIAFENDAHNIVVEDGKQTFISEEFRKIRSALPFLGIGSRRKKILVTSSIPGEGKSFIAANLAQTLALTGKKVVLIDMDLNNPSLHKTIGATAGKGVSEYLTGGADPEEIVVRTSFNENLYFVSTGALPPNPSELLSNGKAEELINYYKDAYDYVVVDTAPVVPVSDAFLLSPVCDTTLYIVRHKYTPKVLIQRLDETLKVHPLHNAAIIFNGVRGRGFIKNTYGYGYGYVSNYIDKSDRKKKAFA